MKKLSLREKVLVIMLVVVVLLVGWYKLFYSPMQDKMLSLQEQADEIETQIMALEMQKLKLQTMEAELDAIFAENPNPPSLPPYDNLHPLMNELNSVLSAAQTYSISFGAASPDEGTDQVVRRTMAISFSCASYAQAEAILQRLQDGRDKCQINNVTLSGGDCSLDITYFEYIEY